MFLDLDIGAGAGAIDANQIRLTRIAFSTESKALDFGTRYLSSELALDQNKKRVRSYRIALFSICIE